MPAEFSLNNTPLPIPGKSPSGIFNKRWGILSGDNHCIPSGFSSLPAILAKR